MYLARILIVGETAVGKTSLLIRFNEDKYFVSQKSTIGVDYKAKEVDIDGEIVKLQIWDTAGQERFRSMTSAFYSKGQGIVLTFDITEKASFTALPSWIADIRANAPEYCLICLCANKIDLPEESWEVSIEEFTAFARENNIPVVKASAQTGQNVDELFINLGRQILLLNRDHLSKIDESQMVGESFILREFTERENRRKRNAQLCCVLS